MQRPPLSCLARMPARNPAPPVRYSCRHFTTKTAVLALILLFLGSSKAGRSLFMVMYGIIYALLENDIRRILAYSIVNQVGFMVCAVGIGTELALNGARPMPSPIFTAMALLFVSADGDLSHG